MTAVIYVDVMAACESIIWCNHISVQPYLHSLLSSDLKAAIFWQKPDRLTRLGATKPHMLISLFSLLFSLLVIFPNVLLSSLTPFTLCLCALFVSVFVQMSLWLCCVLVCCRHCSPVHYFFSVFTAHHWASLSVCLPNLHPKFQLFIYNQLARYCTVFDTSSPTTPPRPAPPYPGPPHPTSWNMLVFIHWHWALEIVGRWLVTDWTCWFDWYFLL